MIHPELEIFLSRLGEAECHAVFRLRHTETSTDLAFEVELVSIDARELELHFADPARYGLKLGQALFGHERAREAFIQASSLANAQQRTPLTGTGWSRRRPRCARVCRPSIGQNCWARLFPPAVLRPGRSCSVASKR
jgi:hypothetical protein